MKIAATVLMAALAATATPSPTTPKLPEVRSPHDEQHIGASNDPQCIPDKPCRQIRATGWVPPGRWPFFAVAPYMTSSQISIQPLVGRAKRDGTFSGLIYLGETDNGAGQNYKIYVFACRSQYRFAEGDILMVLPKDKDCVVSDPIEVYRER